MDEKWATVCSRDRSTSKSGLTSVTQPRTRRPWRGTRTIVPTFTSAVSDSGTR